MPELDQTLEVLSRTPGVLRQLLSSVSDHWTTQGYGPGTWSPRQVLAHLIVAERDDWMPRLRRILEHGESKPFDAFPHDATLPHAQTAPIDQLLDEFNRERQANLQALRALALTPDDLRRTGMHPALGRVNTSQLLATWAVHDLHHLRQIALGMAWQYRDTVGPWRAYLNTLSR